MAHDPLENYLRELRDLRRSGSAVPETSYYPALAALLDAVGATLKPKVRCIVHPSHGAGIPDIGLFTPDQFQKASADEPLPGTKPARGVVEAKPAGGDVLLTADGAQVSKYWKAYRQVLVTNYHDFLLVGADADGQPVKLEHYRLAPSEAAFWTAASHPRALAAEHGDAFVDFLKRVMLHAAALAAPKDAAWFMASYAREALRRVEKKREAPALSAIRSALEEALGIEFEGKKGEHFFRSTLVQTLFYGVFSAWVLWTREHPPADRKARFDWRTAGYYLRVPVLAELFHQASNPASLAGLELPEVLDWTGTVLNRIDRAVFFTAFEEHHAVQYFYEPFLEAYDPELRKQLGVWYTPREVVRYMVARVDQVLREELGLTDGLAAPNVFVLDPCCGTGSYLIEVLGWIADTLREKGGDALTAQEVKRAAMERVFGFEILPAPFVVTHLQIGLMLQALDAPFAAKERAGVYLTNALTGWEPPDGSKPQMLLAFPELLQERDAAERVKQAKPILVILGNPPYNGFAGLAVDEERDLSQAYRTAKRAPQPQGQGLNDLYVRFYRMAERKIVEKTGKGIVCFISNYSWLDGLSFTGMRERYLERFDQISIDCLNGDKYKTGKLTPEGESDPSIFSTEFNREGIQVGTAIALLTRREKSHGAQSVSFRNLWGKEKRAQLLDEADNNLTANYEGLHPALGLGLSFQPGAIETNYLAWPLLPELFPVSFPGVKTSRDDVVVDIDKERLIERMMQYFDPKLDDADIRAIMPTAMTSTARFDAKKTRRYLTQRGFMPEKIVRFCYRPFDYRWLYWEPETKLLDEKRSEYFPNIFDGNIFLFTTGRTRKDLAEPGLSLRTLNDLNCMDSGARGFALYLKESDRSLLSADAPKPNLSESAMQCLASANANETTLFYHCASVLASSFYRRDNLASLRSNWPRIPLPASKDALARSAILGRALAGLLDPENSVEGVTVGKLRPELGIVAAISREGGGSLNPDVGDLDVTAGWGHRGKGGAVMPGKGKFIERDYTTKEREALAAGASALGLSNEQIIELLGDHTMDVYLNTFAFWRNIPIRVWEYTIGGYQVIKKWLSYRERQILGRALKMDEARAVTDIARRVAALLLMEPELDANYDLVKKDLYPWPAPARKAEASAPTPEIKSLPS
ncbi:MAG TPA: type ISP restriction/modification enzyme [Candidatus Binataceae bacterium]|nr:type ISP restriction/modification enzyme [Candidatus Binataceae bacterium]